MNCFVTPGYASSSDEMKSFSDLVPSTLPLMVENQPLSLTLTPVVASQLVQMFGPSDTGSANLSSKSSYHLTDF